MKVASSAVAPLPLAIIKMEDRKRPAGQSVDDLAPPTKRQAVNGGSKASADADMPWKDDLEVRITNPLIFFPLPSFGCSIIPAHHDRDSCFGLIS